MICKPVASNEVRYRGYFPFGAEKHIKYARGLPNNFLETLKIAMLICGVYMCKFGINIFVCPAAAHWPQENHEP